MTLFLTGIFLGSIVGYLLNRWGEKKRIAEAKQDLLDVNERLLREKESLQEWETQLSLRLFKAEREAELKLSDSTMKVKKWRLRSEFGRGCCRNPDRVE